MRGLSSTLLQAQKSSAHLPYIEVKVWDKTAGVTRLRWSRLYNGSEADSYHAATMPEDGSLLRARVDGYVLYLQRVPNPGPGSNFSQWTSITSVSSSSGIALASSGAQVLLFYVAVNEQSIYMKESNDNGATFGNAVLVATAPSSVGWLAADINPSGVVALFYSLGGTLYVIKRTSGVWGSPTPWSHSLSNITGIACHHQGDWNLVVCGVESSGSYKVWTCAYGDGYSQAPDTWSALLELSRASPNSQVELRCPFLGFPDVFRLFFVEKYTGTVSYSRPLWSYSMPSADFLANLWREPVPFDLSSTYGVALAWSFSHAWLSTPPGLWRASLDPAYVDLSQDVLQLTLRLEPALGEISLELRNDDGRYNNLGSGAPIQAGSELTFSPGYKTALGEEVSPGLAFWIEGWEYLSQGGTARFILKAQDGWALLRRWRARRQYSWASGSKNVFQLLSFFFARAGLELTSWSNSSAMVNLYPAFTLHPGESGLIAVLRLMAMVPDVLLFRGSTAYIKNPLASETSVYSYGTDHPIVEGRYGFLTFPVNRVQVYGNNLMSESFAWEELSKVYDRLLQVYDLNLDTAEKTTERGEAELRRATMLSRGGEILASPNCGQELYDVIDITDSRAGLAQAKRRALGLSLNYHPAQARYEQRLRLGEV